MHCKITCQYIDIHKEMDGYGNIKMMKQCRLKKGELSKISVCPLKIVEDIKKQAYEIGNKRSENDES